MNHLNNNSLNVANLKLVLLKVFKPFVFCSSPFLIGIMKFISDRV